MALTITGVDHTLIGWLGRNADERLDRTAPAALDKAVGYFSTMGGRLGHHLAEGGVSHALGLYHHDRLIKTLQGRAIGNTGNGTMHARIESGDESASWHEGTLTLDRRTHRIPHTMLGGLVGRRLRDVVDADWLSDTARIVDVTENQVSLMLLCDTWIVPLEEARGILLRREKP